MCMPTYRTVAHDFISVMKTEAGSKNVKVDAPPPTATILHSPFSVWRANRRQSDGWSIFEGLTWSWTAEGGREKG